eukprot:2080628-Prorocentrum_lima.AAC.1
MGHEHHAGHELDPTAWLGDEAKDPWAHWHSLTPHDTDFGEKTPEYYSWKYLRQARMLQHNREQFYGEMDAELHRMQVALSPPETGRTLSSDP